MERSNLEIKIGDYVKVKKDIKDPDFPNQLLSDWQGKVKEIEENGLVLIEWDAQTKLSKPLDYLINVIVEGYDDSVMHLDLDSVEKIEKYDKTRNNNETNKKAMNRIQWINILEERSIIYIDKFEMIDIENEDELFEKWEEIIEEEISYPFEAKVTESSSRLKYGEIVKVYGISSYDNYHGYGVLMNCKQGRESFIIPLNDLEINNTKDSQNLNVILDFQVWDVNR